MIRPAKNRVLMRIVLKLSPAISYCMVSVYARQQQSQFCDAATCDHCEPAIRGARLRSVNDVDSTVKAAVNRRAPKCLRAIIECRRVAMVLVWAHLRRGQRESLWGVALCAQAKYYRGP